MSLFYLSFANAGMPARWNEFGTEDISPFLFAFLADLWRFVPTNMITNRFSADPTGLFLPFDVPLSLLGLCLFLARRAKIRNFIPISPIAYRVVARFASQSSATFFPPFLLICLFLAGTALWAKVEVFARR